MTHFGADLRCGDASWHLGIYTTCLTGTLRSLKPRLLLFGIFPHGGFSFVCLCERERECVWQILRWEKVIFLKKMFGDPSSFNSLFCSIVLKLLWAPSRPNVKNKIIGRQPANPNDLLRKKQNKTKKPKSPSLACLCQRDRIYIYFSFCLVLGSAGQVRLRGWQSIEAATQSWMLRCSYSCFPGSFRQGSPPPRPSFAVGKPLFL